MRRVGPLTGDEQISIRLLMSDWETHQSIPSHLSDDSEGQGTKSYPYRAGLESSDQYRSKSSQMQVVE